MKIQILKAIVATTTLAAIGLGATAANAATANATARAKILRQLTVINTSDLVCTGTTTAAGFTIGGTTGQVATISVPASVTLTNALLTTMSASLVSSAATVPLVANAGAFTVGGTLSVAANQQDGDYTGTFTATVNYQ